MTATTWGGTDWYVAAEAVLDTLRGTRLNSQVLHRFLLDTMPTPNRGHCGVVVATDANGVTLHLLVEVKDNPGMSVTNAVEILIGQAARRYGMPHYTVEHYEGGEAFDLVTGNLAKWERLNVQGLP